MTRSTRILAALLAGALAATPILAQQQQRAGRLSEDCREELIALCYEIDETDRALFRACLRERRAEIPEKCRAELRARIEARGRANPLETRPEGLRPAAKVTRSVLYGDDPRQQIDVYEPEGAVDPLPLVLFIHGGGWRAGNHKAVQVKPPHLNAQGYYFASTGYRLVPNVSVEQQAEDIGAALRALRGQAGAIGFDPDAIVLMGHSAGAHLAALVATDPRYAGEAFDAVRGVVLLDGAGYDVKAQMAGAAPELWQVYFNAFTADEAVQEALSPITHVGGKDAPHWLALHVEGREASQVQSEMLAERLRAAGVRAEAVAIEGTDHGRMNRELGTEAGEAQTRAVDAFLARVLG
ncbi:alpha/beta hydrolase [Erythrobacter sp. HL-111]|uniref:alpha/beta hydrolase n=1 Tax=Erythrobacter sp. HL-111 TaxID=1798193 RepID=UPI0006D9A347|nr:alpha/beta hydrolase [Erythrobacter sp. HL-111]KPP86650.1 MAG: Esterase/lipase [Erythrobacteraceae bacterium HL-111]SDR67826.1 Acetyl esterase/lipase [Erythrobacter sp. HL-111]